MKIVNIALCAALLVCRMGAGAAIASDEASPSSSALQSERAALATAIAESRKKDANRVALTASMKTILSDPAFAGLSDNERHNAYFLYGALLHDAHNWTDAQPYTRNASEMPQASAYDWDLRLANDFGVRDYADAVAVATKLARTWPQMLAHYTDGGMFLLAREARKISPDVEGDYLEALHQIGWQPKDEFSTADSVLLALMRIRLAHGDTPGAKAIAAQLRDPASILALHIDKRFDLVAKDDPQHFDVMSAYETSLAYFKAKSAAMPDKLKGVNTIAEQLIAMTRYDEGLALTTSALDRLKADPKSFSDADDNRNWTEDIRSRALFDLGRFDEGFAALSAGAAQKEGGQTNVSQAINLADEYNLFDRPKDALAAVAPVDPTQTSEYGRMALEDARACAYFDLGDTAELSKSLDYMKAHRKDGMQPFLSTMLFIGNLDEAAEEVTAELRDPAERAEMLGYLQDYAPDPYPTKRSAAIHAAWIAVRNRPDVAAEIAKAGYVNTYPLHLSTY
ncbi:MAG TPA: hypothetical protein VHE09_13125 [Rhizomicrobium sp.]|nr:hypothetical protein [Rhizomicrobium sp.]